MNSKGHVNSRKLFPTQANLHGGKKKKEVNGDFCILKIQTSPKALNHRHEESSSRDKMEEVTDNMRNEGH